MFRVFLPWSQPWVHIWSLSDSKCPQVSSTLLSIMANLNNVIVYMISVHPLISNSSSPLTKPLEIVPSAPTTISITILLSSAFLVLWKSPSTYLSFRFLSFSLCDPLRRQSPVGSKFSFLLITRSGLLAAKRWSVCKSKSQKIISFSRTDSGLCVYCLVVWSNFNFLLNS